MPRNFGGRSGVVTQLSPVSRAAYGRSSVRSTMGCLTESDAGASWPIGTDLAWDEGHQGTYTAPGSSVIDGTTSDDGSTSSKRTLHVVSDKLTIQAPNDSNLPGGKTWRRALGNARTQDDVASVDMTVSAVVEGITTANVFGEYVLIARNATNGAEDLGNANLDGYIVYFMDDYIEVDMGYVSSVFSPGVLVGGGIFVGDSSAIGFTHTMAPGDTLAVTATGTGSSTVISCLVNGTEYVHITDTELSAALFAGDSLSDLPYGTRAGRGLFAQRVGASWNHGTMDDVISIDGWQACVA